METKPLNFVGITALSISCTIVKTLFSIKVLQHLFQNNIVRWFIHVPFLMFHFIYTILSYPLRQVCTLVRCHVCPSGGEAQTRGVDGIEWASARVCAQYNFGTKKLLLQTQSWARCLLRGFYCVACGCMSCAQLRSARLDHQKATHKIGKRDKETVK